jgi:hypothetical protein
VWEPSLTGRRTERAFLQGGGKSRLLPLTMRPKLLFYISRGGCKIIKKEIIQSSVKCFSSEVTIFTVLVVVTVQLPIPF